MSALPELADEVADEAVAAVDFSVVLATRNRGALLTRALGSVLAQRGVRVEAVVVDDGSAPEQARLVAAAVGRAAPAARLLCLPGRTAGHGPSFARNSAAALARGRWLAFLDDDDEWTDPDHLGRCKASMDSGPGGADLLFGDQRAMRPDGSEQPGRLWLKGLERELSSAPDAQGAREAGVHHLMTRSALSHLNTTVLSRKLFEAIGGFDERLRYEEDRDFCLRAIDRATRILYQPACVGVHHVPDAAQRASASTAVGETDKRLAQLLMYDKALLACRRLECREHARKAKSQVLKRLSEQLTRQGDERQAHNYRLQALATDFSAKWLAHTLLARLSLFRARS
jgi:GT2 family glycosyltransferase